MTASDCSVPRSKTGTVAAAIAAAAFGPIIAACDGAIAPGPGFSHYLDDPSPTRLVAVLSGKANNERREILKRALAARAIAYTAEPYQAAGRAGENVIVEIGDGTHVLGIAAHFDRVPNSPGANDNASCVAAAMAAYEGIRNEGAPVNLRVRFLFFDHEETGRLGSKHYARNHELGRFVGVASLELCGIGDALGVWDVHGPAENSLLVDAFAAAAEAEEVYLGIHGAVPRYSSDHRSFADAGLPAVGITVLPQQDETRLRDYIDYPDRWRWLIPWFRPTIFRTYHGPGDRARTVDPAAIEMVGRVVRRVVAIADKQLAEQSARATALSCRAC
jgi:hypothetical protein